VQFVAEQGPITLDMAGSVIDVRDGQQIRLLSRTARAASGE
jgi:hypothetical protein